MYKYFRYYKSISSNYLDFGNYFSLLFINIVNVSIILFFYILYNI